MAVMRSDDIPNVTLHASDDAWYRCMEHNFSLAIRPKN